MDIFLKEKTFNGLFSNISTILDSMTDILENKNIRGKLLKNLLVERIGQISLLLETPFDRDIAQLRKQAWIYFIQWQTLQTRDPSQAGICRQNYHSIMNTIRELEIPF